MLSRTQGVVGAPAAPRRPVAPAAWLGPAQPRALRARRQAGRLRALSHRAVRGGRPLEAPAACHRGARRRRGRDARALALPHRARLDGRDPRMAPADGPPGAAPVRALRPSRADGSARVCGSTSSTSARRSRRAATSATAGSLSSSSHPFCPWNDGTWTVADGKAKRSSRRPDSASTRPRSAPSTSAGIRSASWRAPVS